MVNPLEISYDAVLPSVMLFDDRLEPAAIKLYAVIKSLTRMHGYCFASNSYLAEALKVESRTIQNWLSSLKEAGYLDVDINKEGITSHRKVYISDRFKESLRNEKNFTPPTKKISPILGEYKKEEETTTSPTPSKGEKKPAVAAFSKKSVEEELKKSKLTPEQVERALAYYAANKETCHAKNVKNPIGFVIDAIKNDRDMEVALSNEIVLKRKEWAKNNESTSSGGARIAGRSCYTICKGTISTSYPYDACEDFWAAKGLGMYK